MRRVFFFPFVYSLSVLGGCSYTTLPAVEPRTIAHVHVHDYVNASKDREIRRPDDIARVVRAYNAERTGFVPTDGSAKLGTVLRVDFYDRTNAIVLSVQTGPTGAYIAPPPGNTLFLKGNVPVFPLTFGTYHGYAPLYAAITHAR